MSSTRLTVKGLQGGGAIRAAVSDGNVSNANADDAASLGATSRERAFEQTVLGLE
jgi:hypothetical protein